MTTQEVKKASSTILNNSPEDIKQEDLSVSGAVTAVTEQKQGILSSAFDKVKEASEKGVEYLSSHPGPSAMLLAVFMLTGTSSLWNAFAFGTFGTLVLASVEILATALLICGAVQTVIDIGVWASEKASQRENRLAQA